MLFSGYVAIQRFWPIDREFEYGRLFGVIVGTLVFGGLMLRSRLGMSRWPYIVYATGFCLFVWLWAQRDFVLDGRAIYSLTMLLTILSVGAWYWRRMSWRVWPKLEANEL